MPNGKASTGPDSGPGIYHNTSMVMSVALRHRTSGAGCAARRKSVSRGFDGFEIDDFRDSGWERDSRASNREPSQGRGGNSATERSSARKLERLREAEHSLDILNRLSHEPSNQNPPPSMRASTG